MTMNIREQKKKAKEFVARWKDRGKERSESQPFWIDLLRSVYGIENPETYIDFETPVAMDNTSYMDGYILKTKTLIEQKGRNKDLTKAIRQSDGSYLTPFQQAKRYSINLPYSKRPRWIITCNFKEFFIYDMEQPNSEATVIKLEELPKEFYRLEFLVDKTNEQLEHETTVSTQAGKIVGEIYDALLQQYKDPDKDSSLHAINQLIVRLVFCFYAEDSGLFGTKLAFHNYLNRFPSKDIRRALQDLFEVLDTPIEDRDPYLNEELAIFPYVNGGMFTERNIEIPQFTNKLRDLILNHASSSFDWSSISPTIFGAVFESTLNPVTRHSGGMHYTSIENIHKIIDPLFLDDLKEELNSIRQLKQKKTITEKAKAFQNKLASLTFFDPACGSGNFLTETYISLRRLENEAIKLYTGDNVRLDVGEDLVKVKLKQFYGIEINDFAVSVAKTALWIAESQMLEETKDIIYSDIDFLPLKSYTYISVGNALMTDWETIVDRDKLSYIIGNPPFIGARKMSQVQKDNLKSNFNGYKGVGNLDFVSTWFLKSAQFIQDTDVEVALVATNSITQGEQANLLWQILVQDYSIHINFAYQTFKWNSEADDKAAVHCVIVGFSLSDKADKVLFDSSGQPNKVKKINGYLLETDNVFLKNRATPLCDVPKMRFGSMPNDNGLLSKYSQEEKDNICQKYPMAKKFFRPLYGSEEFINNRVRWCIWLKDANPSEWRKIKPIMNSVQGVKNYRESSPRDATKKLATTPYLFGEIRQPNEEYLLVPSVSSEKRRYIPIGFLSSNIIANNVAQIIPNASLYHFGILTSNVHMAWMRTVAGRLKSDYRYSAKIVYNNFPWPTVTDKQKERIEKTAKAILDIRKKYPKNSLADLYDELTMPPDLRKAHQENDKVVMEVYDMTKTDNGRKTWLSESETVAKLFEMYADLNK